MIKTIAILGGTHGNELTGVKLIEHFQSNPGTIIRPGIQTKAILSNPPAIQKKVRYIDEDLNRAFHSSVLDLAPSTTWESRRAQELNTLLGPKMKDPKTDFIIDLHTTTANMGITLIVYEKPFNLQIAGYIQSKIKDVHIYSSDKLYEDTIGLQSIAPHSMLVEIGPIAQGLLRHDIYEKMQAVCSHALDYIQRHNTEGYCFHGKIKAFQRGETVGYPVDENNNIKAMIHKKFQDNNFIELKPGDPLFHSFDGQTIYYYTGTKGYPVFINEAAYLENHLALILLFSSTG